MLLVNMALNTLVPTLFGYSAVFLVSSINNLEWSCELGAAPIAEGVIFTVLAALGAYVVLVVPLNWMVRDCILYVSNIV